MKADVIWKDNSQAEYTFDMEVNGDSPNHLYLKCGKDTIIINLLETKEVVISKQINSKELICPICKEAYIPKPGFAQCPHCGN